MSEQSKAGSGDNAPNLKDTVLTPKTDFPMKADLIKRERETLERWYARDLYGEIRKRANQKRAEGAPLPLFVLHDGPPYANGDAHTGTGMNKILKDMVVKYRTLLGFDAPYIPGWDCHGLPIEHKVLEELGGRKPEDMTALEVRQKCRAFAESFIDRQREQFKRTLTLGRWEKPYLTIDPVYEGGVLDCFADLVERGLITRSLKPVHWSWAAQSALAEAELEYEDRTDPSIYVKFGVDGDRSSWNHVAHAYKVVGPSHNHVYGHFIDKWTTDEEKGQLNECWEQYRDGMDQEAVSRILSECANRLLLAVQSVAKYPMLLIWTTTPWTLPANQAVAVSPSAEYGVYQVGEEAWIMAVELAPAIFEKAGNKPREPKLVLKGDELTALTYRHAIWDTPGHRVVTASYVTLTDGTGLVHTAPGHGQEDFQTGQKYGLPTVCPVDEKGCYYRGEALLEQLGLADSPLTDSAKAWFDLLQGQHILKANKLIIQKLESERQKSGQPLMVHWHEFNHSYPHCWRTHKPVIFRATEQWFVSIDGEVGEGKTLRQALLEQVAASEWFPAWGRKRIGGMIENRPDWCISRQRYWGIPIPAFRDPETGRVCAGTSVARRIADVVREHGSDVWYDLENWSAERLLPDEHRPEEFRGKPLERMNDIFDVWFESGASHRGVVAAESELGNGTGKKDFRPADLYLEGDDQHRGWFQVSLILSTATQGVSPFRQCLTSAFVVDEKGQKGSKSKGNIFAIDWGCEQVGADLLRLYFASVDTSSPIPVTLDLVRDKTSGSYRTLRNTIRVLLGNLDGFDPATQSVEYERMLEIDRWALSRLAACVEDMTKSWERYEFHVATRRLVDFCNLELSAFYIDVTKDRMYCHGRDSHVRRSGLTAMHAIVSALIRLLAPVCPHTADEAWSYLPGRSEDEWCVLLSSEGWPASGRGLLRRDLALEESMEAVLTARESVEQRMDDLRKTGAIKKSVQASVKLPTNDLLATQKPQDLATYLSVSEVELLPAGGEVSIAPSPHPRCDRCWNHWPSVAPRADVAGAALCDRCHGVVRKG